MERENALAEKLRRVGYDLARLTEAQRAEIFALARSAHVELWQPGVTWPSSPDAGRTGGGITPNPAPRP